MSYLEIRDTSDVPTIPEYYKGKTIFITGGSGFMGQALVEKLLYSCPKLEKIYLLMREKKGVLPEDRLEKLYSSSLINVPTEGLEPTLNKGNRAIVNHAGQLGLLHTHNLRVSYQACASFLTMCSFTCFERLKGENPTIFKEKVHIIPGDVIELGLGLSDDARTLLINRVNIVFHVAASVRFDDPLKYAVKLNLRGTKEVINLAKEMRQLSSFIHISTCYSNIQHKVIDETLYPPLGDWRDLLEVCETMDETIIRVLTPKYINGMPNTYIFTKHLSEHMINEERGGLPVAIIRPSIVVGSMEEPMPGWVNNFNGPSGLFLAVGKGLKSTIYGDPEVVCDYIPLDACIKNFIITAWAIGTTKFKETDPIPIINCSTNEKGMLTIDEIGSKGYEIGVNFPLNNILWHVRKPVATNVFFVHYAKTILLHLLPAIFIDLLLWLFGQKTILTKLQRKIYIADLALFYFTSRNWTFNNTNFLKIRETLKPEDRKAFYYKIEKYYTDQYIWNCLYTGKKYLLHEDVDDEETLAKAKAHAFRMMILDKIVHVLFYGALLWWLFNTKRVQNLLSQFK